MRARGPRLARALHRYLIGAVQRADWTDPEAARGAIVDRMRDYLPSGELQFLMELSIDPLADQLAAR